MSKSCYNELAKREKKRIQKAVEVLSNVEFNVRVHLKMAFLYEFG